MQHSTCMAHSSIPVVYGGFPKADTKTTDLRAKAESSSAYMLIFAMTYAIGVLLTLAIVAVFCHWNF